MKIALSNCQRSGKVYLHESIYKCTRLKSWYTPVSMVCANISSPSNGAGGSSDASGGSFRHSWASCMLDVMHDDHPWESQFPSNRDQRTNNWAVTQSCIKYGYTYQTKRVHKEWSTELTGSVFGSACYLQSSDFKGAVFGHKCCPGNSHCDGVHKTFNNLQRSSQRLQQLVHCLKRRFRV